MKYQELKKNNFKQLRILLHEKEAELGKMRFLLHAGKSFKQVHLIRHTKRDIARIRTRIIARKQLIKNKKKNKV